jgi:ABC-type phosphate/phosphonate transport system ATPase subunit
MSAIEVKNLVKKFHGQTVLHGIDLEVQQGEVVAIIGPSGSAHASTPPAHQRCTDSPSGWLVSPPHL